jgi:two-component system, NtrC family, response regulator AtoC
VLLPPLRERREDVLPLARLLLHDICQALARPLLSLSSEAQTALQQAAWPGNIRQLRNVLERAAILSEGPVLEAKHLPAVSAPELAAPGEATLSALEKEAIVRALATSQGNRRKAAEGLGIGLRTLYDKLKRYGLS